MLLLATARPDLLDLQPEWPHVVRLEPLNRHDAETLMREVLGAEPAGELVTRAGGNPLFVHELARIASTRGDSRASRRMGLERSPDRAS